jgi:hypothetical protein
MLQHCQLLCSQVRLVVISVKQQVTPLVSVMASRRRLGVVIRDAVACLQCCQLLCSRIHLVQTIW